MRKILPIMALTTTLAFTSCIKNEESDGVKALREAQASLINAKATTEVTRANAEAAYENARAALVQAQAETEAAKAAMQLLQNAAQELRNDLLAAENVAEKERITAQLAVTLANIAVQKAQAENNLLVTQANAEAQLNYAKIQLEGSIRALKAEVAKSATENPALDEYVSKYETVLGKISNLQEDIIADKGDLAKMNLFQNFGSFNSESIAAIAKKRADLVNEQTLLTTWQTRYETVVGDVSSIEAEIIKANAEKETLTLTISDKEEQLALMEKPLNNAFVAMESAEKEQNDASDNYSDALLFESNYNFFMNTDNSFTGTSYISNSDIDAVDMETDASQGYYHTIAYYDAIINDANSTKTDIDDATAERAVVREVVKYYAKEIGGANITDGVAAKKAAYYTAENSFEAAQDTYNTLNDDKNALDTAKSLDETNKGFVEDYIDALEGSYNDITDNLSSIKEDLIDIADEIAVIDTDATTWSGLITLMESEITNKETKLSILEEEAIDYKALIDSELAN